MEVNNINIKIMDFYFQQNVGSRHESSWIRHNENVQLYGTKIREYKCNNSRTGSQLVANINDVGNNDSIKSLILNV